MHASQRPAARQQQGVRRHASRADAPAMFNLLTGPQLLERVEAALPAHRERLYPPTETLSMFVAQVLSADGSCQQAVDAAMVKRLIAGLKPGDTDTGAYCKARARLPVAMISTLARECGDIVANEAPGWWLWRGRRVTLVDGATVTLADTEENQAAYPQPSSQKTGLGFPLARLVALVCLGSGVVRDVAVAPCAGKGSDERTLARDILDTLQAGEILVADALYATYFLFAELIAGYSGPHVQDSFHPSLSLLAFFNRSGLALPQVVADPSDRGPIRVRLKSLLLLRRRRPQPAPALVRRSVGKG
jgi:hypothetical protein